MDSRLRGNNIVRKENDAMPNVRLKKIVVPTFIWRFIIGTVGLLVAVDHITGHNREGSFGRAIGEWNQV